jgi:hypothetical protein
MAILQEGIHDGAHRKINLQVGFHGGSTSIAESSLRKDHSPQRDTLFHFKRSEMTKTSLHLPGEGYQFFQENPPTQTALEVFALRELPPTPPDQPIVPLDTFGGSDYDRIIAAN